MLTYTIPCAHKNIPERPDASKLSISPVSPSAHQELCAPAWSFVHKNSTGRLDARKLSVSPAGPICTPGVVCASLKFQAQDCPEDQTLACCQYPQPVPVAHQGFCAPAWSFVHKSSTGKLDARKLSVPPTGPSCTSGVVRASLEFRVQEHS